MPERSASNRYPGYDVLSKRDTPSWNDASRRVIAHRLATLDVPTFFNEAEWQTLRAICDRIIPQPDHGTAVPLAAMVDRKVAEDQRDGYRQARLPPLREAWRRGLMALDAEAQAKHGARFHTLTSDARDELLTAMQRGQLKGTEWGDMPAQLFFKERVTHDILAAYYCHPKAWTEIGFGGPASPRGYVRMGANRRDPWEAVEAKPGHEDEAREANERVG
jgi:hypothetical protein